MEKFTELYNKGSKAVEEHQFIEALSCYTEALAIQPKSEKALGCRSSVYAKLRLFNESQKDAQALICIAPTKPKGYFLHATALQQLGQYHECLVSFLKAYEVNGQHDKELLLRAIQVANVICHQSEGKDHMELPVVEDALDQFRELVEAGKRLYKCGEYLLSIKVILTALQMHCHFNVANFNCKIVVRARRTKLLPKEFVQGSTNVTSEDDLCSSEQKPNLQMTAADEATGIFSNVDPNCFTGEQIRDTMSALLTISQAYIHVHEYSAALLFAKQSLSFALESKNKEYEVKVYVKLVNIYQRLGEFFKVISYIGSLLAVGKDLMTREDFEECDYQKYWNRGVECKAIWNLVAAYKALGNYEEALYHAKQYLDMVKPIHEESLIEANCMVGGLELLLGNHKNALDSHKVEMQLCKKFSNQAALAYAYGNVGTVYTAMGQYKLAAVNHDQHLKLAQNLSDNVSKLASIKQIGDMYMHKEEFLTAVKFYQQHLSIAKMNKMEKEQCQSYKLIAMCHWKLGQLHHAQYYFKLCMEKAENEGEAIEQFECKLNLATILKCLGQYVQARQYYDDIIPVLEHRLFVAKQAKCEYSMYNDPLVAKLESCYIELQEVLVEIGCSDEALEIAERYHSRTFLNNQQHRMVEEEERLSIVRSQTLQDCPVSVGDISDIVNQQSAVVVMYSVLRTGYLVWVLVPGRGVVKFHRLHNIYNKDALQNEVKKCLEKIHHKTAYNCDHRAIPNYLESSSQHATSEEPPCESVKTLCEDDWNIHSPLQLLYSTLWVPVEEVMSEFPEGSDIVVIPNAILRAVPFSSLQDKAGTYLHQKFRIRMLSCLKAISLEDREKHSSDGKPSAESSKILVTGNPAIPEVEYHKNVWFPSCQSPLAEQELTTLASLLGVEPLTGHQATKDKVLQNLPLSSVVHIATYGSFKEGTLALTPNPHHSGSYPEENSYLLTLSDITKLTLNTKLAVLNSCCGCSFQYSRLESMTFDLPMALLAAGVKAVVIPLWSVPQPATLFFLYHFYSSLEKGKKVSEALQHAQGQLVATDVFSAPVFWSSFIVMGFDTTVELPQFRHQLLDQLLMQETQSVSSVRFPRLSSLDSTVSPPMQKVSLLQSVLSELIRSSGLNILSALKDTASLALRMIKAYKHPLDEVLMKTRISSDVLLAPGAKEFLVLMGFDFQEKESNASDPFVLFPHWDIDTTLETAANLMKAICGILSISPIAVYPLAKVIAKPWEYKTLGKLENMLRVSTKFPEKIMKTSHPLVRPLWCDSDTQRYLAAIGFYAMGQSLLFSKTTENQRLLQCGHQIAVVLLAYYEKVCPPIRPAVPQIQEIQSTPWMSVTADDKENRLKISLAEKIQKVNKEFAGHVSRANYWHAQLLKKHSKPGPTLPVIGRSKEEIPAEAPRKHSPGMKVKVVSGMSPSCNRVPVAAGSEVSLSTTREQRSDIYRIYADRYDNIAMRKRLEIRQLFM